MDEYASRRLRSPWATMNGSATAMLKIPKATRIVDEKAGPRAPIAMTLNLARAYRATARAAPDSSAEIGLGAWLWASGNHVWKGTRPAFVP
jgi:hypothetical protein